MGSVDRSGWTGTGAVVNRENGNGRRPGAQAEEASDGGHTARHRTRDGDTMVLLLSVEEAGTALGIGRTKTYELIAAGFLEAVHIGRCARVPVDSVERYVDRLRGRAG